jgi:hypothetical protein
MVPCWCGDQAIAFTAATCSLNLTYGLLKLFLLQIINLLSFPPEASYCSSGLHFKPHTSCLCPSSFAKKSIFCLISRCKMVLSLDPLLKNELFHAMQPILPSCPLNFFTIFYLSTSQFCSIPLLVPTARNFPEFDQLTLVMVSWGPRSYNLVTLEVLALQRYTQDPSPTARTLSQLQSTRFR